MSSQDDLQDAPDPFNEQESVKLPTMLPNLVRAAADIVERTQERIGMHSWSERTLAGS